MSRAFVVCFLLAGGGVGAAEPPVAPAPHPALPQRSLIVVEEVTTPSSRGVDVRRILRIGVRNGKLLPAEKVWEGDEQFLGHFGGHRVVADRYFVTKYGGVIDMCDGKVLNDAGWDEFCAFDGTKVFYRYTSLSDATVYSFDITTRKNKEEAARGSGKYAFPGVLSPDGNAAVERLPHSDELVLHQVGSKPKSLGEGFSVDLSPLLSSFRPPVLWLNNGTFLTQRGNGKLVTLDVAGKMTELLTIKDAPKHLGSPYLFRDGSNRIVYDCGTEVYTIDVEKKKWAKSEWRDLGHGFEASWERQPKLGHKLRHNGKEFAQINCWPHTAQTAPGILAVEAQFGQEEFGQPECVAVWAVDVGEWQTIKLWPNSIVGWVK